MPYLSDILHRRVLDASGDDIGRLKDLVIVPTEQYPPVQWAILATSDGERVLRWAECAIESAHVRLRRRLEGLAPERIPPGAVRLGSDLLDREVGVAPGASLAFVNDVQLEETGRQLRVMGADIGLAGLLRRIGIERLAGLVARIAGRRLGRPVVPWQEVDLQRGSGSTLPLASR